MVIHHSGTGSGSAASFHRYHTQQGWGGLTYHFVIGNGEGDGDGIVTEGFRWKQQITGTHVTTKSWEYNIFGIGICLVGNFNETRPTEKQMQSLLDLVSRLMVEHGIPVESVIGHNQVPWDNNANKLEQTACPAVRIWI